ncbi:MAG: ATP-binding protein [Candidatus Levybacteria bacterium]|nr:ATP-binding protein [Candidatus Levybacteria bacterium]
MKRKTSGIKNVKKTLIKKQSEFIFPFLKYIKHHPSWNTRAATYPLYLKILIPVIIVLVIFVIKNGLDPFFRGDSPYLMFFAAIMISAWYGGFKPAFLATILSAAFIIYFFLNPTHKFEIKNISDSIKVTLFIMQGVLIGILSQSMHNSLRKLEMKNFELKRSEEHYRLIVETVKDYAIYTLNPEGYITSWNQGAQRLKGYTSKEIIGKHFSTFYPQNEIDEEKPWNALKIAEKKGQYEEEGEKVKKDGSKFWANEVITPIFDEVGELHGFSKITRDMTTHSELDKRKDEFISIASHELKTPITSIKVFNQIMQKLAIKNRDKDSLHYLARMESQINRLTQIITDLLDVSKIQSGKLAFNKELFDLNYLAEEIVENLQNTSKQKIVLESSINKKITGDKERINQVLINFLTNAIKYSPNTDKIIVKIAQEKNNAVVGVQDFGIGIPKKYREKIFERFYRITDDEKITFPGLGMGLYISSEIIKRHKGKIWVESTEGKGSTFYFSLPFS